MAAALASVRTASLVGIDAALVEVQVEARVGIHAITIVGLGDKTLHEARERISAALAQSGFRPPNHEHRKITINLAPANLRKVGTQYDLALAIGYLCVTGQLKNILTERTLFFGELGLDGVVRSVPGSFSAALCARTHGCTRMIVSSEAGYLAELFTDIEIVPVTTLRECVAILTQTSRKQPPPRIRSSLTEHGSIRNHDSTRPLLHGIVGQHLAKRAVVLAAAGGHHLRLYGPPGTGKTLLARALVDLLPDLTRGAALRATQIASVMETNPRTRLIQRPPLRMPHHTMSRTALIGGGGVGLRPGEITLAHEGVLFLDEAPEIPRYLLDALRQPLEDGFVHLARASQTVILPACFQLVIAMNPCPCGFSPSSTNENVPTINDGQPRCTCTTATIERYRQRLSGPLLDRIDIHAEVPRMPLSTLLSTTPTSTKPAEHADDLRLCIAQARARQLDRCATGLATQPTNARLTHRDVSSVATLTKEARSLLEHILVKTLSVRSYHRILAVARTSADLGGSDLIQPEHLAEAIVYRSGSP